MSYAGFQRSEVPNIGKDVSGIMQHQMDVQAKEDAQQKALIAKGLANDQKVANENEKQNVEISKPLYESTSHILKSPSVAMNEFGHQSVDAANVVLKNILGDKSLSFSTKIGIGQALGVAVQASANDINDYKKNAELILSQGSDASQTTKYAYRQIDKRFSDPNNFETAFDQVGQTYNYSAKDRKTGEDVFNGYIARNLGAIANRKVFDYDAYYKTKVNNVGKVEIMNPLKGGGTELRVNDELSPKFVNERETTIKQLLANKNDLGDAMYYNLNGHPMVDDANNTYKVELVPSDITDSEKEELAKLRGTTADGKDMLFVKMQQDKNGLPIANLTDDQSKIFESVTRNHFNNLAMDKYSINKPNITNVNVNSNEKKESATITRVRLGDENAIKDMVAQMPTRKITIGAANSKGEGKSYIYDPENKLLTIDIIDKESKPKYDSNGDIIPEDNTRTFDLNYEPDMEYLMRLLNEPELQKVGKYSPKKR